MKKKTLTPEDIKIYSGALIHDIEDLIKSTNKWEEKILDFSATDLPLKNLRIAGVHVDGLKNHIKLLYKHFRETLEELKDAYREQERLRLENERLKARPNN